MLSIKSDFNIPHAYFDAIAKLIGEVVPSFENRVPKSSYHAKKLGVGLGLPYEKIHCCINSCMLYSGVFKDLDECNFYKHPRWKPRAGSSHKKKKKKNIPYSIMHYIPITQRLQRLYALQATVQHMKWHKEHQVELGEMIHPLDTEAWKNSMKVIHHSQLNLEISGFVFAQMALPLFANQGSNILVGQ